jgi:hypothetical protein
MEVEENHIPGPDGIHVVNHHVGMGVLPNANIRLVRTIRPPPHENVVYGCSKIALSHPGPYLLRTVKGLFGNGALSSTFDLVLGPIILALLKEGRASMTLKPARLKKSAN